jgi:hypothetical protein
MPSTSHDPLPAEVIAAAERGETIEAIKILRARTGMGLAEAKDAVDAWVEGHPVAFGSAPADGGSSRILVFMILGLGVALALYFFLPALRSQ